jgi:hypothetical protein
MSDKLKAQLAQPPPDYTITGEGLGLQTVLHLSVCTCSRCATLLLGSHWYARVQRHDLLLPLSLYFAGHVFKLRNPATGQAHSFSQADLCCHCCCCHILQATCSRYATLLLGRPTLSHKLTCAAAAAAAAAAVTSCRPPLQGA